MFPYISTHADIARAEDLVATFGDAALLEAASRARRSRDIGNHIAFCRWRQIERLLMFLDDVDVSRTLH